MSTRFYDDQCRIEKQLEMSTYMGRYQLDKPGQGVNLPYMEDCQIRLQSWGANLCENVVDIENTLRGASKPLTKDGFTMNSIIPKLDTSSYPKKQPIVDESRASHPAWSYRDIDMKTMRWEEPWLNPQDWKLLVGLSNTNIGTRLGEKDMYNYNISNN